MNNDGFIDSAAVRRYSLFKWVILIILFMITLIMLLRGCGNTPSTEEPPVVEHPTTEPAADEPVINAPTLDMPDDAVLADDFTFTGTGSPSSKVRLLSDGEVVGTAVVGTDKKWSITAPVEAGEHEIAVEAVEDDGNSITSSPDSAGTLTVYAPPAFSLPENPEAGDLVLNGTGTPGSTVELMQNGRSIGTAVVDADGNWELPSTVEAGTEYEFTLHALDSKGNELSSTSSGKMLVKDAPVVEVHALTITDVTLNNAAANASGLTSGMLTGSGHGEPGFFVQIERDGEQLGDAKVCTNGNWTFELEDSANEGEHSYTIRMTDSDGAVVSEDSFAINFPPISSAASTSAMSDSEWNRTAPLMITANDDSNDLLLTGAAIPNADVEVYIDGELVTTVTADENGRWQYNPQVTSGEHEFYARTRIADNLDADTPTTLIAAKGDGANSTLLSGMALPNSEMQLYGDDGTLIATVTADENGRWQYTGQGLAHDWQYFSASAKDGGDTSSDTPSDTSEGSEGSGSTASSSAPIILGQNQDDNGNFLTGFAGTGRPSAALEIIEDGEVVGFAIVQEDGSWSCNCSLPPGDHVLSIREEGDQNSISESIDISVANPAQPMVLAPVATSEYQPFSCPTPNPPGKVEGNMYKTGCGESLSLIAMRLGTTVETLLAQNPQLGDPPRIYVGQYINVPQASSCLDANH